MHRGGGGGGVPHTLRDPGWPGEERDGGNEGEEDRFQVRYAERERERCISALTGSPQQ